MPESAVVIAIGGEAHADLALLKACPCWGHCMMAWRLLEDFGPLQVQELELNADMKSVDNLLSFLEKVFNGGSDFKYACLRV